MTCLPQILRRPTLVEVAARELADSELQLLAHQNAVEYSVALIGYHRARIARLRGVLADTAGFPEIDA